jgi:phi13 family phage major tail protein
MTISVNSAEYLTSIGLSSVYVAEITQDDASAYIAGTPAYLAPVAALSGAPTINAETLYYDDQAYEFLVSEGTTERKLTLSALPPEMEAWLTGEIFNSATGRLFDHAKPSAAPYFALGYKTQKSNGSYRYVWFLKGKFQKPGPESTTLGESADPKQVELTYTALKTIYGFTLSNSVTDGAKRVAGDDDTTNFDETGWFTAVQTPATSAPSALTCTPVPADGATNIVVTDNLTFTFNNRIRSGSTGVILTKDDGTIVAGAFSWNAGYTVLTYNPTNSLAAGADYLITLSGVTDIYGQVLANVVYNFTTAA